MEDPDPCNYERVCYTVQHKYRVNSQSWEQTVCIPIPTTTVIINSKTSLFKQVLFFMSTII